MNNIPVNFKFGSKLPAEPQEGVQDSIANNDLVAINEGYDLENGNSKYGSIYRGRKMVGTTKADSLYTTSSITIAGGPMEDILTIAYPGGEIPAGTSMQELFMALACVEKWPENAKGTHNTMAANFGALGNITIVDAHNNGLSALMVVGTPLTLSDYTGTASSVTTQPKLTYSGYTWGYRDLEGNLKTGNPPTVSINATQLTGNEKVSLTRTIQGFAHDVTVSATTTQTGSAGNSITIPGCNVVVAFGADGKVVKNKITYTQAALSDLYTATVTPATSVYYAASNLKNIDDNDPHAASVSEKIHNAKPANVSKSTIEVTAVWPIYSNIKDGAFTANADSQLALQTSNVFEFTNTPTEVGSANNFMFDYPSSRTVTKFEMKDPSGNWANFSGSYQAISTTVTKTIHGVDYTYNRLSTAGGNGPMTYRITLSDTLDKA